MKKIVETEVIENTLMHFPEGISKEIDDYVINKLLQESRYIFVTRKNKGKIGYCTHCKKSQKLKIETKHKGEETCKECKSVCRVQFASYSRKNLFKEAEFVYYEKSLINKDAIIARAFDVIMDFSGDYKDVRPEYKIKGKYLFEMDNPVFLKVDTRTGKHELRKTVFTLMYDQYSFMAPTNKLQGVSGNSIAAAVKDTPFQYSMYRNRSIKLSEADDYVKYFATYAKYPQIEYVNKMGFGHLVESKVSGESFHRSVNWQADKVDKLFKVTKQELRELVKIAGYVDIRFLEIYQRVRKSDMKLSVQDVLEMKRESLFMEWKNIEHEGKNARKLLNFLRKTIKKDANYTNLRSVYNRLIDYWDGCKILNLTIDRDVPKYPSDLNRSHDNIFKQIKFKQDAEMDKKIKARLEDLNRYIYENENLIIRPFTSTSEIIEEGKQLKHCVGNYINRYADGTTDLFAIRKKDEPNKPFYTLEMKEEQVNQYYGIENNQKVEKCKEVIAFVEAFKKALKNKKEHAA